MSTNDNKPMRMPIGIDIFGEIIERKMDYVDKTLFIKACWMIPLK